MEKMTHEKLDSMQKLCRFLLFITMVLLLVALFALVSRWSSAFVWVVVAGVFHLVSNRWSGHRYKNAFIQALMEEELAGRRSAEETGFATVEKADGALQACGFVPELPVVAGARKYQVLHGRLQGTAFTLGEVMFIRRHGGANVTTVGGTLLTAEGLVPADEQWIIFYDEPFSGLCFPDEFQEAGFVIMEDEENENYSRCAVNGAPAGSMPKLEALLRREKHEHPLALAAKDGTLSLFVKSAYYAPAKVDTTKAFKPAMLKNYKLKPLDILEDLIRAAKEEN